MSINIFKKISLIIILSLICISSFNLTKVSAEVQIDQAFEGLNNLSSKDHGLIPCDPYSTNVAEQCHPKDAITLLVTLGKIFIYVVIIGLMLVLIIGGVGYVYYGKSPSYLTKWKGYMKNSAYALLIIVFGITFIVAILGAVGMDTKILDFIKSLLADKSTTSYFELIPHTFAQNISDIVPASNGAEYVNFFPGQSIITLFLNAVKFLINYVAAPALVLATI